MYTKVRNSARRAPRALRSGASAGAEAMCADARTRGTCPLRAARRRPVYKKQHQQNASAHCSPAAEICKLCTCGATCTASQSHICVRSTACKPSAAASAGTGVCTQPARHLTCSAGATVISASEALFLSAWSWPCTKLQLHTTSQTTCSLARHLVKRLTAEHHPPSVPHAVASEGQLVSPGWTLSKEWLPLVTHWTTSGHICARETQPFSFVHPTSGLRSQHG